MGKAFKRTEKRKRERRSIRLRIDQLPNWKESRKEVRKLAIGGCLFVWGQLRKEGDPAEDARRRETGRRRRRNKPGGSATEGNEGSVTAANSGNA